MSWPVIIYYLEHDVNILSLRKQKRGLPCVGVLWAGPGVTRRLQILSLAGDAGPEVAPTGPTQPS